MSNFKKAMKWLEEGKKIKRPDWQENSYWFLEEVTQRICWRDGTPAKVYLEQLKAKDWKIFNEKLLQLLKREIKRKKK